MKPEAPVNLSKARMLYGMKEYQSGSMATKQEIRVRALAHGDYSIWVQDASGDSSLVVLSRSDAKRLALSLLEDLVGE